MKDHGIHIQSLNSVQDIDQFRLLLSWSRSFGRWPVNIVHSSDPNRSKLFSDFSQSETTLHVTRLCQTETSLVQGIVTESLIDTLTVTILRMVVRIAEISFDLSRYSRKQTQAATEKNEHW